MPGTHQPDFVEYLRLRRRRQPVEAVAEYEEFLGRIDDFIRLRLAAEDHWREHPNRACGRNGPLPLHWGEIAEVLRAGDGPPERLVVRIGRERSADVAAIGGNLRKTLLRLREKTPLGRVQQIDPACLRWLTRQPGRTPAEKAGAGQRILGVVRRENFDTLENRVFKDFLLRAAGQCRAYLDDFGRTFADHPTLGGVRRFRNLCMGLLEEPVFDAIRGLDRLPSPNYVLQQDGRYAKIWQAYLQLVRQEATAERLWTRKAEVDEAWLKLRGEWPEWTDGESGEGGLPFHTHPCAQFDTPLWFNVLDGRRPPLDAPFWKNNLGHSPLALPPTPVGNGLAVLDLTGNCIWRRELAYGPRENEKPHFRDSLPPNGERPKETVTLDTMLKAIGSGTHRPNDGMQWLKDYFEQLAAALGAERWVVLVPDDWPAAMLERILAAASVAMPRSKVFLLWRSVAASIDALGRFKGLREGMEIAVFDEEADGNVLVSKLEVAECAGRFVPRRLAYRRMAGKRFKRFSPERRREARMFAGDCRIRIATGEQMLEELRREGGLAHACFANALAGGYRFDGQRRRGEVPYYDELEGLYLVVTRRIGFDDKPVPVALVEPNDRISGGAEYKGPEIRDFSLEEGEKSLEIYLSEGAPDPATPLKLSSTGLERETQAKERLLITTRMTPGQGLAECTFRFESGRLRKPVRIDLAEMKDPPPGEPRTLAEIEENLPRSFPPDLPLVEASSELFERVRPRLENYMAGRMKLSGKEFSKARLKPLPFHPTPIDRLRRENVFGNAPGKQLPSLLHPFDFDGLFRKLAADCKPVAYDVSWGLDSLFRQTGGQYRTSPTFLPGYMRLIAWTYQSGCPAFASVKSELLRRYEDGRPVGGAAGFTLLAHLCAEGNSLRRLYQATLERIAAMAYSRDAISAQVVRLLYNMLQFHPAVLEGVDTGRCKQLMIILRDEYDRRRRRGAGPQVLGSLLRAMLFLLNRRRYDENFLRVGWERDAPPAWISCPIGHAGTDALREAFIAYVCGKGTWKGIPIDDGDD